MNSVIKERTTNLVARAIVTSQALAHLEETSKTVSLGITRPGPTIGNARAW